MVHANDINGVQMLINLRLNLRNQKDLVDNVMDIFILQISIDI